MMLRSRWRVQIVSVDRSKSRKEPLSSCNCSFYCEQIRPQHKIPAIRMEFGLPVWLLNGPLGAKGFSVLIHINWAGLPSYNEPCEQHIVLLEMEINQPLFTCSPLGVNGCRIKHKRPSKQRQRLWFATAKWLVYNKVTLDRLLNS